MLSLTNICKTYNPQSVNETVLFKGYNLTVPEGEFVTIVGSNGSGKSSLLNMITGMVPVDSGEICLGGTNITRQKEARRQRRISRVFQDPAMGTCPAMTIWENLSLADNKNKSYNLGFGLNKKRKAFYQETLAQLSLGLENKLDVKVGSLSGGQRQALSLVMATLVTPDLLLLDEHTAALDPATSQTIMELTAEIVAKKRLTTLMVTHNLKHAVAFGDRLVMMHQGQNILDKKKDEKQQIATGDLLKIFNEISIECGN